MMKFTFLSAAIAYIAIPSAASAQTTPENRAAIEKASADVVACLNAETAKVAPLTTEPAADMASLVCAPWPLIGSFVFGLEMTRLSRTR